MADKKQYLPGVFIQEAKNPTFLRVGVKLEEHITYLKKLKPDDRGWVNFQMAKRKDDPTKYSIWLDDWKPDPTKGKGTNGSRPAGYDDSDDNSLPF